MRYFVFLFSLLFLVSCDFSNSTVVDDNRGKALITITGEPWRFSDYKGKWIVVNYWASWCKPCITEVPELDAFYQAHKDKDAIVLGVNYDFATAEETALLAEKYGMTYPVLTSDHDPREQLSIEPVMVLPTTFIINPEGKVVATLMGEQTQQSLEREMTP